MVLICREVFPFLGGTLLLLYFDPSKAYYVAVLVTI